MNSPDQRPAAMPSAARMLWDIIRILAMWCLRTDHPIRCARDLWRHCRTAKTPTTADEFVEWEERMLGILAAHGGSIRGTEVQRRWKAREFWNSELHR